MKVHTRRFLVTLFVVLSLVTPLLADDLSGTVFDPDGRAVANASLRLYERNSGQLRTTKTSPEGAYTFKEIPRGSSHHCRVIGRQRELLANVAVVAFRSRLCDLQESLVVSRGLTALVIHKISDFLADPADAGGRRDDAMRREKIHDDESAESKRLKCGRGKPGRTIPWGVSSHAWGVDSFFTKFARHSGQRHSANFAFRSVRTASGIATLAHQQLSIRSAQQPNVAPQDSQMTLR